MDGLTTLWSKYLFGALQWFMAWDQNAIGPSIVMTWVGNREKILAQQGHFHLASRVCNLNFAFCICTGLVAERDLVQSGDPFWAPPPLCRCYAMSTVWTTTNTKLRFVLIQFSWAPFWAPGYLFATAMSMVCYQLKTANTKLVEVGNVNYTSLLLCYCNSLLSVDNIKNKTKIRSFKEAFMFISGWLSSWLQKFDNYGVGNVTAPTTLQKSIFLYDSTLKLYNIYFGALENMIIELFRLCGKGRLDKAL